ncbi:hypothetical protein L1987_20245 [Smallanthus sonchifolius]|uniref:Uncharacterized protein n=1 Tax=Smallanthus sonchifolius TaxID=185202 RepID=A0ACB9IQT0_9ASTR|nr:hypothetical protein L1987_20245 [Smallanthus sonchifolius]
MSTRWWHWELAVTGVRKGIASPISMQVMADKVAVNNKLEYAEEYILEVDIMVIDVEEGVGDGDPKSDVNPKMIIDLFDYPEARRRRIRTVVRKEAETHAETHHDQESGNNGGKGK